MKCELCKKEISKYNTTFNHLVIDESQAVDICQECIDKFIKWQGKIISVLFPTNALKKRFKDK